MKKIPVDYSRLDISKLDEILSYSCPNKNYTDTDNPLYEEAIRSILWWALEFEKWAVSADKNNVIIKLIDCRMLFTVPEHNENEDSLYILVGIYPDRYSASKLDRGHKFRVKASELKRLSAALINQMDKKVSFQSLYEGCDNESVN